MKIIVVGAGLFGSMAATLARKAGHQVIVVDARKPLAASKCAACLMKPSWMTGLAPEQIETGYAVLQQLYGVTLIPFTVLPKGNQIQLHWVNPADVLLKPDITENVIEVGNGALVLSGNGLQTLQGTVLVAAGAYSDKLVRMPSVSGLIGAALYVPVGNTPIAPRMRVYAPYRQAMVFNITPRQVWAGDGCAVKHWQEQERVQLLRGRTEKFFGLGTQEAQVRTGARPYVEGFKQGYFAKVYPRTWVSTGGAKNGTILAAYQAHLFVEAIS